VVFKASHFTGLLLSRRVNQEVTAKFCTGMAAQRSNTGKARQEVKVLLMQSNC
jgi:hypothetical protein